jgi:hypothetical protein
MLTTLRLPLPSRPFAIAALAGLSLFAAASSRAEVASKTCFGGSGMVSCVWQWGGNGTPGVISLDAARNERDAAEAAERDRKWAARCKPVVRFDRYGVQRYGYAAPGCEFGRYAD